MGLESFKDSTWSSPHSALTLYNYWGLVIEERTTFYHYLEALESHVHSQTTCCCRI